MLAEHHGGHLPLPQVALVDNLAPLSLCQHPVKRSTGKYTLHNMYDQILTCEKCIILSESGLDLLSGRRYGRRHSATRGLLSVDMQIFKIIMDIIFIYIIKLTISFIHYQ